MENEYIFLADLLNKYSQLTPWVQVVMGIVICGTIAALAYFLKEVIFALIKPFTKKERIDVVFKRDEKRANHKAMKSST